MQHDAIFASALGKHLGFLDFSQRAQGSLFEWTNQSINSIYRIDHLCCIVFELDRGKPPLSMNRYDKFIEKVDELSVSNLVLYIRRSLVYSPHWTGDAVERSYLFCLKFKGYSDDSYWKNKNFWNGSHAFPL